METAQRSWMLPVHRTYTPSLPPHPHPIVPSRSQEDAVTLNFGSISLHICSPCKPGHHFRAETLHWPGNNHVGCVWEKARVLWLQRRMKSEAHKRSCQVIQAIPPPKAGSPLAMGDQKESTPHHSPPPGQKVSSWGRRQGKHLWPPKQESSTKLGKFSFFMKGWARIFNFQRKKEPRKKMQKRERVFESCCRQVEPAGSFPPLPAIQYYHSIRKGHFSIQMGSYEITLHLVLIRITHTIQFQLHQKTE